MVQDFTNAGGRITGFRIRRFAFARERVIGDSQVRSTSVNLGVLELETDAGLAGTGFFQDLFHPLPDETELARCFAETAMPGLEGACPAVLVHRLVRPRGGNNRALPFNFAEAVEQAVWDLHGRPWACRSGGFSAAPRRTCRPMPAVSTST